MYVAVPPTLKFTVNGFEEESLRVNVYTIFVRPSSNTEDGDTDTVTEGSTASSSVIVPVADDGLPIVYEYPVPDVTVRITVSSGSTDMSGVGSTITWAVVLPPGMTTVPDVPLKLAVPLCV